MMRLSIGFVSAAALAASVSLASAQSRVEVGVLECTGTSTSFIIGSVTELGCAFKPSSGGPSEPYSATIRRVGLDIGINNTTVIAWAVFAPTRQIGPRDLAGNYGGVSANATIGVGLGANALVGGSNSTIALQPASVQAQTGLSIAAGISGLELRAGR
ncbi:unnamed protein product [Phaeothamnion confervicola]